ncbi:MAG: ABC transporter ATP-binding protein [Candidatus Wildermuthbacteria bacterium]|nr:ABC transporter ATP-binding protein [Candidatus Wildermuthbacteria bacterium]
MGDIIRVVRFSWELKRYYIPIALFVVFIALLNQTTPFVMRYIVDGIVAGLQGKTIPLSYFAILIGINFGAGIVITLLSNISGYWGDQLAAKLHTLLSRRYYQHLLSLPIGYFDNTQVGSITSKLVRGIETVVDFVQTFTNNFSGFFLTSFVTLGIIAYYSWPTALFLAVLFPLYIWITTLSSRAWQKKQLEINQHTDIAQGRFVEAMGQMRTIKSFVKESLEYSFFGKQRQTIEAFTKSQSQKWHWYDILRRLSLNIIFLGIYGFIVWQTFQGRFTLGEMTLLIQLATQAQFPLFASSFIVEQIQKAKAGSKDFFDTLALEPSIKDKAGAKELQVQKGKVEYQNVSFQYEKGARVLQGISFAIPPGTKLALVGESGEGKTTIANLLMRFFEPLEGSIRIDGTDITDITQASLRKNIAAVFQSPSLFSGTVRENIAYGKEGTMEEEIVRSAKAANAEDFIMKLPQGYDTLIGERGVKLSGGQQQRIAIARAVLKDAPILILDEATSSLDSRSEREVQKALEVLMQGRTTLIIAHRLSTIQNVDTIVTLKEGRVDEIGTPEELASTKGIYAELLKLQQMPILLRKQKLKQYDVTR